MCVCVCYFGLHVNEELHSCAESAGSTRAEWSQHSAVFSLHRTHSQPEEGVCVCESVCV